MRYNAIDYVFITYRYIVETNLIKGTLIQAIYVKQRHSFMYDNIRWSLA